MITAGACNTPMALTDSQNRPSAVEALPIVAQVTSLPLFENSLNCFNSSSPRYTTDAYASPTARGICAPVGETSSATLYMSIWLRHEPSDLMKREPKWAFIERPPVDGSCSRSACAYNCAKNSWMLMLFSINIQVWSR